MHLTGKIFRHADNVPVAKEEGGSVLNHIYVFKEIVADLLSMEVEYDDEDLGLLLLCSLPSSFAGFRDTILLSRDEVTVLMFTRHSNPGRR
jgi:hypothetical protein